MSSFISKLLRPSKSPKTDPRTDAKRRYSAPPSDWLDIHQTSTSKKEGPKLKDQSASKNKRMFSSQQNLATHRKSKESKSDQNINKRSRHSTSFPSWFCVYGDTDTLDRKPLPQIPEDVPSNAKKKPNIYTKMSNNNGEMYCADVVRRNNGKNLRETAHRHSMPASAISSESRKDNGTKQENSKKPTRDISPGVKYRFDGTLEKPYVFPAGLTFGPEGRKLVLRRSSDFKNSEQSRNGQKSNEHMIKADVHRSSTEDIMTEYSYEVDVDSPHHGTFDVKKAFYLKYDSDQTDLSTRTHSPESVRSRQLSQNSSGSGQEAKLSSRWKPKEKQPSLTNKPRSSRRQEKNKQKATTRYSLPPKNEELVYMGSLENISDFKDVLLAEAEPGESNTELKGTLTNGSVRRNDQRKSRKNRYSMPAANSDLVYMGSFENLSKLLIDSKNMTEVLLLPKEDNIESEKNGERNGRSLSEKITSIPDMRNCDDSQSRHRGKKLNPSSLGPDPSSFTSTISCCKSPGPRDSHKAEFLDHVPTPNMKIVNIDFERSIDSEGEGKDDVFDSSSASASSEVSPNHRNIFTRQLGRSSYMPGNSRFIAPPPAIISSKPSYSTSSECFSSSSEGASFLSGKRRFHIPPPPSYTPPKEEMEFTHAQLKQQNTCHQGSQTDLTTEEEIVDMEERDQSLRQEGIRTITPGISTSLDKSTSSIHRPLANSSGTSGAVTSRNDNLKLLQESPRIVSSRDVGMLPPPKKGQSYLEKPSLDIDSTFLKNHKDSFPSSSSSPQISPQHCIHSSASNYKLDSPVAIIDSPPQLPPRVTFKRFQAPQETPPVPKQRRSLAYSRSLSGDNQQRLNSDLADKEDDQPRSRTQSFDVIRNSVRKTTISTESVLLSKEISEHEHKYDSLDKHVYDYIDDLSVEVAAKKVSNPEHIYDECDNDKGELQDSDLRGNKMGEKCGRDVSSKDGLLPVRTMLLSASPGQQRRLINPKPESSGAAPRSYYCGLASSLLDLTEVGGRRGQEGGAGWAALGRAEDGDSSSVADDEMSNDEEEDVEERLKALSLRRCVSADNLLRAGSIIDRSMILAHKRKKRMRDRKSRSHYSLTRQSNFVSVDQLTNGPNWKHGDPLTSSRVHYAKRKATSNERLFKPKPSQVDSGHDSDIVSPCTSPDTSRHMVKGAQVKYLPASGDVDDSCAPRQGTLPKKPWEIRLRNMQYQRKSRSRENLLTQE